MPIYEYRCRKCGNVFEEWVKTFDSPELEPCPKCGGDAERIMSNTSFKLEGGGWCLRFGWRFQGGYGLISCGVGVCPRRFLTLFVRRSHD